MTKFDACPEYYECNLCKIQVRDPKKFVALKWVKVVRDNALARPTKLVVEEIDYRVDLHLCRRCISAVAGAHLDDGSQ